jgi:hypothetical protein
MKNNLLFFIGAILLFATCDRDEIAFPIYKAGDKEFGSATGTRSGQQWEASGLWRYHSEDSTLIGLTFQTFNDFGEARERYSLNEIPAELGTYTVRGTYGDLGDGFVGGSYSRLAADGDALIGRLDVNDDKNGFVEITSFNENTKTVKGTFEIYFANDTKTTLVEIKDGEFEVRLYE